MDDIILKEREVKEKIVNVINESKLPALIVRPIIKEILEQLVILEQQQYEEIIRKKESESDSKGEQNT